MSKSFVSKQLREWVAKAPKGKKTMAMHDFGYQNAATLKDYTVPELAEISIAAGLSENYGTELNKTIRLALHHITGINKGAVEIKPTKNIYHAPTFPMAPEGGSDRFGAVVAPIGKAIGLERLGCMYTQVEPGKRAFPYHNHLGADEMFVILEGEGTYRFGDQEYPIKPGDICGAPKGGPETAHQIINTGDVTLKYLGISTMVDPEVVQYPDSGKFAAIALRGQDFMSAHLKVVGRERDSLDYWDGEEV